MKITKGRDTADFLVDTGSVRTIIGESLLKNKLEDVQLIKTNSLLRSYTGDHRKTAPKLVRKRLAL